MKEKLKNKKLVYSIIGIISILLVALALTYAYWLVTKEQAGENQISSACLDIEITGENNDIVLGSQYPISDDQGKSLTPYEFTVTNKCDDAVDYQISLETMPNKDDKETLSASALKVMLDETTAKTLDKHSSVDTTISGATASNVLGVGTLKATGEEGSSATHKVRIWIDANAPINQMNKTYTGKISVTIGQGMEIPYEEGTLAYTILKNNEDTYKTTLTNEWYETYNKNGEKLSSSVSTINLTKDQKYSWGTEVVFDKETGLYSLAGNVVEATVEECRNKTIECGEYTFAGSYSTESSGRSYSKVVSLYADRNDYSNYTYITYRSSTLPTNSYMDVSKEGLFKTIDEFGDSYIFKELPTNNYVKFGTYAEDTTITTSVWDNNSTLETRSVDIKAGTPMYWRIVRINGDGSIRLVYDGVEAVDNDQPVYPEKGGHIASIGMSKFNNNYANDFKYVGYTYDDGTGKQVDSAIKGVIDAWYAKHLNVNYGKYIEEKATFCNDRSTTEVDYGDYSMTLAGAYRRNYELYIASLLCPNKTDNYSVDSTKGNGLLTYPVGLLTSDEAFMAGGEAYSSNIYLYSGENHWTLSPAYTGYMAINYGMNGEISVDSEASVRPVINLRADVDFTGLGTKDSPYEIVMN